MNNFVQPGEVVTLTAPTGGVVSGTPYKIGSIFAVATADADETEEFEGKVTGVFDLPKATGTGWSEGDLLYWDDSAKKVTKTAGANILIGVAIETEASGDTTGRVRLNGTASDSAASGNVVTADIAAGAVTFAKAAVFISAEQTGDGGAQTVAHGLGVVPAGVLIVPTDLTAATVGQYAAVEGTHTTTNVVVTVTNGKKYKVFAWA